VSHLLPVSCVSVLSFAPSTCGAASAQNGVLTLAAAYTLRFIYSYYPPPLVHTRCCDQPICTECFVQIKRAEPDATHLESEPAACPYCMEPNFGCVYVREPVRHVPLFRNEPQGRAAANADAPRLSLRSQARPKAQTTQNNAGSSAFSMTEDGSAPVAKPKPRRKSFAHTEKEVVTTGESGEG